MFCTVSGPIVAEEVLKKKNCPPVVPTGPPVAGVMKAGLALQENLTAEVERCTELIEGEKAAPGHKEPEGRLSRLKLKPTLLTTSTNITLLVTVPQLFVTTNL